MVWSCDTWALVGRSGADNRHNLPILRFQRIPLSSTSPSPTPAAIESETLPPLFTPSGFSEGTATPTSHQEQNAIHSSATASFTATSACSPSPIQSRMLAALCTPSSISEDTPTATSSRQQNVNQFAQPPFFRKRVPLIQCVKGSVRNVYKSLSFDNHP
eukprot:gb/GECG01007248.1/.p1 GENE.gb/GECG01007248.1/~~gb/GECG01007248.1/.p1  ORF type:complete len:159 (+),score=9.04 gb/GECG01007248.1/:1-477(+)